MRGEDVLEASLCWGHRGPRRLMQYVDSVFS